VIEVNEVLTTTLELLREKPDLGETLRRITEYEAEHYKDEHFKLGWEWKTFTPPISPQTLHMLHRRGIIRLVYDSRSTNGYLTADPEAILKALSINEAEQIQTRTPYEDSMEGIPEDLFDPIVGYDDVKKMIHGALEDGARVHWLFAGPPASAKTLFLLCLERLPGSGYIIGSRMSRAGLSEYLIDTHPRFLLIDEVDKLPNKDLAPLLSLCETGRVIETLYGRRREETLDTVVFSAANEIRGLSRELLSRFEVLSFPKYTRDQFVDVGVRLLSREGTALGLASYISSQVWDVLRVRDVRETIRVSRLAGTKAEVDGLINILRKYQPKGRMSRR
jgi:Holliday junction DNA helicase RuvB